MTKLQWVLGSLFIVVVLGISFINFGNEAINSTEYNIDNESKDYMSNYENYFYSSNLSSVSDEDSVNYKDYNIVGDDNETGEQSVTDILANLNFYKNKIQPIVNTIKLIFNVPTFLIESVGLPIQQFKFLTHIINTIFYIAILVLVLKLIRGT